MNAYQQESADKCPLNKSCNNCTCHSCALAVFALLICSACISAATSFSFIGGGKNYDVCPTAGELVAQLAHEARGSFVIPKPIIRPMSADYNEECCEKDVAGSVVFYPATCTSLDTAMMLNGATACS